jgi:pantoate--beta-alanine ligase
MLVLTTPEEVRNWLQELPTTSTRGFVPTMGALHRGHEALLQSSLSENDVTVLSIFVNPTQFNELSDYENYPSHHSRDLAIAEHHGVDMVYLPSPDAMYPKDFGSFIEPGSTSLQMEGLHRPGHFRGVTTVVAKLFNIVQPHKAYFGKKDFQQLSVIRQMARELNFPVDIIGIDTVRESDGLAMSSRNQRLNPDQRQDACKIYEALVACKTMATKGNVRGADISTRFEQLLEQSALATVEYATVCDAYTLELVPDIYLHGVLCVAVWYGDVRLIDNIEL